MRIPRFNMEDWLNDHARAELNLAESGCADLCLNELLTLCETTVEELAPLWLGNNDTQGSLRLRQGISTSYERVTPADILVANGTSEALFAFFNEILEPGDEVILPTPAFQCLHEVPRAIGCNVKTLDLLLCDRWHLDVEQLEQLLSDQTKLLVINTPHNPLGWTLDDADLQKLGELASIHDIHLLFDEHYRFLPLVPGTDFIRSGYDVCRRFHEKTHATGSMIKCFGIVGLRIGWLISDGEIIARCRDYKDYLSHTIPLITDHLAALSLEHSEKIITHKKRHILPNLAALREFMAKHNDAFEFVSPTGGVVCFPKVLPPRDATELCQRLIRNHGLSLLPGFGFGVEGHLRINFGVDRGSFNEALSRLESAL